MHYLRIQKKKKAEKNLAILIMSQEDELASKSNEILCKLLDMPTSSIYDTRQTFTFVASVDRTLEAMYVFYEASFNRPFNRTGWEEKPFTKVSIIDKLDELIGNLNEKFKKEVTPTSTPVTDLTILVDNFDAERNSDSSLFNDVVRHYKELNKKVDITNFIVQVRNAASNTAIVRFKAVPIDVISSNAVSYTTALIRDRPF